MTCCKEFLEFITQDWDPDDGIDIRAISGNSVKAFINPIWSDKEKEKVINAICDNLEKVELDVYVGVLPRRKMLKDYCGSDNCVGKGSIVWFDHDFHDGEPLSVEDEKEYILSRIGFLPTMLVFTGRGYHGYFRLKEKISRDMIREVNRAIAKKLGSDILVSNPSRIMRICGSYNTKANRRSELVFFNKDAVFSPYDFIEEEEKKEDRKIPVVVNRSINIDEIVNVIKKYYVVGHRNQIIMSLLGSLIKNNVAEDIASEIVDKITVGDEERNARLYLVNYHYTRRKDIPLLGISGLAREFKNILIERGMDEATANTISIQDVIRIKRSMMTNEILDIEEKMKVPKIASQIIDFLLDMFKFVNLIINDVSLGIYYYNGKRYEKGEEFSTMWLYQIYESYKLQELGISYRSLRGEFLKQLYDRTKVERDFDRGYISFKNGILNVFKFIETGEINIIEHTPDIITLHYIDHEIDTDMLTCEDVVKCFMGSMPDLYEIFSSWSDPITLLEVIGYTLLVDTYPLNKVIMLLGDGSNGKSSYLSIINKILGDKNIAHIPIQDLAERHFAPANLYGKMANIFADLPSRPLKYAGIIKALSGEDVITADRKNKERITFFNYAKLIFSANELPKTNDLTDAYWRRWVIIDFPNKFDPDPQFKLRLEASLDIPKLIALSLVAIKKVLERGKFSIETTGKDVKEKWMRETNPVYAFIQDMLSQGSIIEDRNSHVRLADLYDMYSNWVKQNEDMGNIETTKVFSKKLEELGYRKERKRDGVHIYGLSIPSKGLENLTM